MAEAALKLPASDVDLWRSMSIAADGTKYQLIAQADILKLNKITPSGITSNIWSMNIN